MSKCVNQRIIRPGHGHMTIDRVAKLIVKRYEIEEEEMARNVLLVHGKNLRYMMDHPRRKAQQFFAEEPIYQELSAELDLPAADIRRAEAIELRPRRDHTSLKGERSEDSDEESSEDAVATPRPRPNGRKKKGRLSVLRPKSSKYSGKGKGVKRGKGKGKRPNSENSSAEEDASAESEAESESASDIEIDTPTQALSPRRQKRKFIETDGDEEDKTRRKRAASESMGPGSPPSTEEDDEDTDAAAESESNAPLPLRYLPNNIPSINGKSSEPTSKPTVAPPIVSTPLPTYEANGPRDSWICTFDGCSRRIYGASKDIGRQLITEHLEDHAKGRHTIVGVLLREEEKLSLPVK